MSLTNPNKVVTEERLSEFYGEILPYLGGMPELLGNKISRSDLYSTSEKIIGQWTDGKPLYQKTVDCGTVPNATSKTIAHNISNIDSFVKIEGIAQSGSNGAPLPFTTINNITDQIAIYANDTNIVFVSGKDRSSYRAYVTLQYTKTTDSAQAIGVDTDYSTTEKIVGTWIDGKPIYQKTISCGALPNATEKSIVHNISNIDIIISIDGTAFQSSGITINLPYVNINNVGGSVNVWANRNSISLETKVNVSSYTSSYVTLQYTKTID